MPREWKPRLVDAFGRPLNLRHKSTLGQKFVYVPFTVWYATSGAWQDRKRLWTKIGIRSEIGRGSALTWDGDIGEDVDVYRHRNGTKKATTFNTGGPKEVSEQLKQREADKAKKKRYSAAVNGGKSSVWFDSRTTVPVGGESAIRQQRNKSPYDPETDKKNFSALPGSRTMSRNSAWLNSATGKPVGGEGAINANGKDADAPQTGTSIFDPVLCELFYRWFTPANGIILDPFAGGSVRGIVANTLGRRYVGVDLRQEQIDANEYQAKQLFTPDELEPFWLLGDSRDIDTIMERELPGFAFDAVFSCPPYHDLELYSDDPLDLSNVTWDEFCHAYETIIRKSVSLMADNRFACFVVGDVRDPKTGLYKGLPWLTIDCFRKAGCALYNQVILVTAAGSLPLRTARQFTKTRKLGMTHQYILIFLKGDPALAGAAAEPIEFLSTDTAQLRTLAEETGLADGV